MVSRAAPTIVAETFTRTADVPSWTANDAEYVPAASVDVLKLMVSVPAFVPLVGETVSQLAVGADTVQRSRLLPDFETCTVLLAMLVPTVP